MRLVYDIEATGLLDSSSLDYSQYPIRLKDTFKIHCIVFKDIDTGKKVRLYGERLTKQKVKSILSRATTLIAHNQIDYDLLALRLYFGVDYQFAADETEQSFVEGQPCEIVDTVVMSRMMWPDRPSGHSLKEWGKRLGMLKGDYGNQEDAWSEFSQEMLEYCEQDVDVNEAVYHALVEEWGDWDWSKAFVMEQAIAELTTRQEHFGFAFDVEKAEKAVEDLNTKLSDIEARVEPRLPLKEMNKGDKKKVTPPKQQIKKDGNLSTNMEKFVERVGGSISEDEYGDKFLYVNDEKLALPLEQEPLWEHEPMTLANQMELKEHLVELGWQPTVWNENDLSVDAKKHKKPFEKYKESVVRYCQETANSEFKKFRLQHKQCKTVKALYDTLIEADTNKPVRVITAPKYTIDNEKTICPNLNKLGEKVDFVEDVVYWLTYRHRRNNIFSPKGTGFLAQPRIHIDGRIQTPAITCGAASSRYRHQVCVNIPRPTSLYGGEMRELFKAADDCFQIGCDASGLEARVEAHYTKPFPEGDDYAADLLGEKPNDIHSKTARKMGISRDDAKSLKYAVSYGAQPPKIAKQMSWSLNQAKKVFEDFWEAAKPLKMLKHKLSLYWKKYGNKQFIKGIDGRKLMSRSEHSLINLLFQSCGVIIMKKAAIILDRWLEHKGYLFDPFRDSSFKGKAAQMQHYHDEYQLQVCPSLVEVVKGSSDEDVKDFSKDGHRVADISHVDSESWSGFSPVGEKMSLAIAEAAEYYEMRIAFDGDYQIGTNWSNCH